MHSPRPKEKPMNARKSLVAGLLATFIVLCATSFQETYSVRGADERDRDAAGVPLEVQLRVDRGLKYLAERQQEDGSFGVVSPKPEAGLGGRPGLRVPVTA